MIINDPYWFIRTYEDIWVDELYRFVSGTTSPLILDCGANIGLSVIYFKYFYPRARVVAFEPDPKIFQVLKANVASFGLLDVTLEQKALWSSEGIQLFEPDGSVGGRIAGVVRRREPIEIQTVRLRDWLDTEVEMLKIDIEGAELEVLVDCQDQLANVNYLFVEYHSQPNEPQRLDELLLILGGAGFRYHIKDANPILHPFVEEERSPYYDLQLNIFAYRV